MGDLLKDGIRGLSSSNGQVEASNKTILHGLKTRLEKAKGKWADELPSIL